MKTKKLKKNLDRLQKRCINADDETCKNCIKELGICISQVELWYESESTEKLAKAIKKIYKGEID